MIKNALYSVIVIGVCLALGKLIAIYATFLPASLFGMLIFTSLLHFNWVNPVRISATISFIIRHMGVCFVPAGVGIINHYHLLKTHGIAIVSIIFVTTFLLLTFVGLAYQHFVINKNKKES